MIGPLARIAARYIAGALVAYGVFAPGDAAVIEPDLALAIGTAAGAAVLPIWKRKSSLDQIEGIRRLDFMGSVDIKSNTCLSLKTA